QRRSRERRPQRNFRHRLYDTHIFTGRIAMTDDLALIVSNQKDPRVPSVGVDVLKTLSREEVLAWEAT
ncbi:MAG: hypothetical protein ACTSV2_15470, partial [Candidatus Thorarchaeota archaeon]